MKDNIFIDTNVLLYLLASDIRKKNIAKEILSSNPCISTQVLNEFCNICLKKFKLSVEETETAIIVISESAKVSNVDVCTIKLALEIKGKYKFQYYDSLILAAAIENRCTVLLSEDLQHNQLIYNKLRILNPFLAA